MKTQKQLEETLYKADPFALEVTTTKTTEELQNRLMKLYEEAQRIPDGSSSWSQNNKAMIELIETVLELRRIAENDGGGVSVV